MPSPAFWLGLSNSDDDGGREWGDGEEQRGSTHCNVAQGQATATDGDWLLSVSLPSQPMMGEGTIAVWEGGHCGEKDAIMMV